MKFAKLACIATLILGVAPIVSAADIVLVPGNYKLTTAVSASGNAVTNDSTEQCAVPAGILFTPEQMQSMATGGQICTFSSLQQNTSQMTFSYTCKLTDSPATMVGGAVITYTPQSFNIQSNSTMTAENGNSVPVLVAVTGTKIGESCN